jgi:hypothetical protein
MPPKVVKALWVGWRTNKLSEDQDAEEGHSKLLIPEITGSEEEPSRTALCFLSSHTYKRKMT